MEGVNDTPECAICFQPCFRPTQCQGPCAKYFCFRCMSNAKLRYNRCPNRCSEPFVATLLPSVPRPPLCPYHPKECPVPVQDSEKEREHFKVCPLISQEKRVQQSNKNLFKCHVGHNLTYLNFEAWRIIYGATSYMDDIQSCHSCKARNGHRAVCLECSTRNTRVFFCNECRPPPASKRKCPLGHNLKKYKKVNKNRFCDLCDVPASMAGDYAYGNCGCDFDLCQMCFDSLPDKHPLIPVRINYHKLMAISLIEDVSSESEWSMAE